MWRCSVLALLCSLSSIAARPQQHRYPPVHACGLTARALFGGRPLHELPLKMKRGMEALLQPHVLAMAEDPGLGIDSGHLSLGTTLLVSELSPGRSKPAVYAAMWENPTLCGTHQNCPVWLVEETSGEMRLISAPRSARNGLTAWAAGLQTQPDGTGLLLLISSGYYPHGGGKRIATCERLHDGTLEDTPCSTACDADVELNTGPQ